MVLILVHFFLFILICCKVLEIMRVFCPTDQGLVGGGTHFPPQTHAHKHNVLCMFLNKAAKTFPSLIIWVNNYCVGKSSVYT